MALEKTRAELEEVIKAHETKSKIQPAPEEAGQPAPEPKPEAAPEELELDSAKLAELPPEKMAELLPKYADAYANSKRMTSEAHKRNEEAREALRKAEEERKYAEELRLEQESKMKEYDERFKEMQYRLSTSQQQPPSVEQKTPPNFDENPNEYVKYLENQVKSTQETTAEKLARIEKMMEEERATRTRSQQEAAFESYLNKEILPNYKGVTRRDLDDWFTANPQARVDDYTIKRAAGEIKAKIDQENEARWQEYLKSKETQRSAGQIEPGQGFSTLKPEKGFMGKPPQEQEEILKKDIENLIKSGKYDIT